MDSGYGRKSKIKLSSAAHENRSVFQVALTTLPEMKCDLLHGQNLHEHQFLRPLVGFFRSNIFEILLKH